MSTDYSENAMVERPAIDLFARLGYETANTYYEHVGEFGRSHGSPPPP
jgi:type I restriction enzyme, R subunit